MKYKNLEEPFFPQDFGSVFRWAVRDRLMGRRREAPSRYSTPTVAVDKSLFDTNDPSLVWVGHATWIVRLGGVTIFTDPNWASSLGPGVRRNVAPALSLEEAPLPDVVVISHNHRDHLDAPTIKRIGPRPTYVVPEGLARFFHQLKMPNVVELPWWGEHMITTAAGGTATIAFVPSQHWSQRGPFDRNETLWGGFVMSGGGRRAYFAGDTAFFGGFAEIGRRYPGIDAALLPIGAYDPEWFMRRQHMNPEDAVHAFRDLGARLLCAMHWGTFKLTDEPLDEPPRLLVQESERQGVPADAIWIPPIGGSRRL